jgi:tetratricopeptide (TPR) repeat protein
VGITHLGDEVEQEDAALPPRYEDLGEIAQGGMGTIHEIEDRDLRRTVAMKVLRKGQASGRVHRFVEEAQVTGQLEHPNIPPVYELGVNREDRIYFTMKRVRGQSLDAILDRIAMGEEDAREAYPLSRLLELFLKVCEAVAFAHSKGVIHRDIKPENIMVGKFGEVLLMDWGLAKVVGKEDRVMDELVETIRSEREVGKTLSGGVLGTPSYMPPEQARGEVEAIDEGSDIWSLGAVLYSLLTLEPPYAGTRVEKVLMKALQGAVIRPRKRTPSLEIPKALEGICLKAMAVKKEGRYASVGALMADLRAYLDRQLVSAYRYGWVERFLLWVQRHPTGSVGGGFAILLLLMGISLTGFFLQREEIAKMRTAEAERREKDARARAETAEDARDTAELMLRKGRKVSKVLRSANLELRETLLALERSFFSPSSLEEKQAVGKRLWPEVERFGALVEKDPPSQAALLAVEGWLKRMSGNPGEAFDLFRRSRETDEDVAYGWLFEGMVWLSKYISEQPLPGIELSERRVATREPPRETAPMKLARENFERFLDAAAKAGVWGEIASRDFRAVLSGFRALHAGNPEEAEKGITVALSLPETGWMRTVLLLARAKVLYLRHDFDRGIGDVEEVVRRRPEDAAGHYYLGHLLTAKGLEGDPTGGDPGERFRRAVASFDAIMEKGLGGYSVFNARGLASLHLGKTEAARGQDPLPPYRRAIADFSEALSEGRERAFVFNNRGNARLQMGLALSQRGEDPGSPFQEALGDLEEALNLDPDYLNAFNNRGIVHLSQAERASAGGADPTAMLEKALADFNEVLKRKPDHLGALSNRGNVYRELARTEIRKRVNPEPHFKKALADFSTVLESDPAFTEALHNRGETLLVFGIFQAMRGGDPEPIFENALADLDRALRRNPRRAEIHNARGNVYLAQAERRSQQEMDPGLHYRKAVEAFDAALALNPRFPIARFNRARSTMYIGNRLAEENQDPKAAYGKSLADLASVLAEQPRFPNAHLCCAKVHLGLGDYEETRKRDPLPAYRKAVEHYSRALADAPASPRAYFHRGNAHKRIGDVLRKGEKDAQAAYDSAIGDYERALQIFPGYWRALAQKGLILDTVGRFPEAVKAFEKALALSRGRYPPLKAWLAKARENAARKEEK